MNKPSFKNGLNANQEAFRREYVKSWDSLASYISSHHTVIKSRASQLLSSTKMWISIFNDLEGNTKEGKRILELYQDFYSEHGYCPFRQLEENLSSNPIKNLGKLYPMREFFIKFDRQKFINRTNAMIKRSLLHYRSLEKKKPLYWRREMNKLKNKI